MAGPSREEMMKLVGKPSAVPTVTNTAPLFLPKRKTSSFDLEAYVNKLPAPRKADEGNPIFNIPVLGPVLDFIDTPRAAIVSGLKEFGDIFDDDESFSASDWWRQTDDNIFMGEVLRDWGVDLPGPLDFALGLTLDIAFDPLTYMMPMGAWARMASKKRVIDNFLGAADTAAKAKDFTKAVAMIKASERVSKGGVFQAGKEALEEIGLDTAIKFSVPLSGRLGQGIFERPLRMIPGLNAKWGKWMDARRVQQLGQVNVGPGGKWAVNKLDITRTDQFGFGIKQGFDIANPYNLKKVGDAVFRLNSANRSARRAMQAKLNKVKLGAAKGSPQFAEAVLTAARMPVEMGFRIPQGFGVLAVVAGVPGKVMGAAMQQGLIRTIAEGLSTNFHLNQMYKSGNVDDINRARHLELFAARATNTAGRILNKHLMELQSMGREAKTLGIDDFDLIFRGANETMGTPFAGAIDPIFGPLPLGGDPKAQKLAQRLNTWFDDILEDYNIALPHREDLEALKNELYITRQIAFEEVELLGKGRWLGEGSGLTGSPFKNRELHLPDTLIEARKAGKFEPEEIKRVEALLVREGDPDRALGELFDESLLRGKPVEITAKDGQIYRSKFMSQGFLPEAEGGSVLTQMDRIGQETLGSDYKVLFTTDSNLALNRYLEQMIGQIRGQKIVDDLAEHGIMFKSTDSGVINASGKKMVREINAQTKKQNSALRKKAATEKKVVGYADTISNYNPEEALGVIQTIRAASQDAPPLKTGKPGRPRKVQPAVELPTSYPPRSLEDIYQDLPKNQKGRAAIRAMIDDPIVAQYAANRSDLDTTTEVIAAIIRGDAEGVTAKGQLLLAQGAEALPHPSGRYSPNVRPLVPPEGSPKQVRAQTRIDATEADIASATEHIESLGREITLLDETVEQLRFAHTTAPEGTTYEMRAAYTVMQEHVMENKETLRAIVTNFTRNVLENVTSVQGARFLDEFGKGVFGDVILFSKRTVHPSAERKLDIQNRWLNRLEQRTVDAKQIDIDVGSGGIPREWWEAYKEANPNWETTSSVRPAVSGNRVVLRDVNEIQMERFQQFTDDWLAQKGGAPPPRKPASKVGKEPPTWTGALTMRAENWPAQFVDDVLELIEFELAHNRYLGGLKFSTGPRAGKGQKLRPTDGALREYKGTDFTIRKVSDKEWRVVVDGEEIPISGPNARSTKAGEEGLVLWLPIQKRLIRFNPNPRQASMATDVTASGSKQALSVAKRIGKRVDDAAAKRLSNMAEADSLRNKALARQEELRARASAEVEKKVDVFEEYRLAQYGKETTVNSEGKTIIQTRDFAPKPVGRALVASRKWFVVNKPPLEGDGFTFKNLPERSGFLDEWGGRVVDEVEVRIPSREAPPISPPKVPLDRSFVTGQGVVRLKDGTFVVDSPGGRVRLTAEEAATYQSALRAQEAARKSGPMEFAGTQGRAQSAEYPSTTEVKEVFAVNVWTDEMLVYSSPPKSRQEQRYVERGGDTGPIAGTKAVSNMNEPLIYVRPAPGDVRMASSREGGLWDVVDVRPGGRDMGKFDPRETVASLRFRSRMKTRGWVLLDDVDSIRALEDGTYVVPPTRAMRGSTVKEQDAIEEIFNHPTYRLWIERVQEAKRLEDELMAKHKLRYSERNSTMAAKDQAEMRLKQATQDVLEAKATGLEDQIADQIAAGVRTNVNNQTAIVALRKHAESLDSFTEEGLQAIDEVHDHLATVVKPLMKAKAGVVEINEETLGIVNAHYVQEFKISQEMALNRESVLKQAAARGVAKSMDQADTQMEALKILQGARNHAGLNSTYDELLEDYLKHASSLGKSAERSQNSVSARTRQHLNGYQLVNAGDETVEMFEAAFQSAARLRDPDQFRIFGKRYGQLVNYWKAQAVATSGFVFRNQLGGTWINNQIAGVPVVTQIRVDRMRTLALQVAKENGRKGDVAWGAREIAKRKKGTDLGLGLGHTSKDEWSIFSMWADTGMANTGITSMEVKSAITEAGANFLEAGTIKPWSRDFYLFGAVGKFNQRAEFSLRGGLAHHIMMNGGTSEDALAAIYKYHFDYANLTHWDQRIKQVIPFWTWQKNILPVLLESFGTRPQAWGRLVQVKGELELTSEAEGLVPDYFAENMGIRLPFSTGGNRVYALPDLPFRDLARYLKTPTSPGRGLVESALPFYKLPIEIWAGKRTFADIPFSGRYQQVPHSIRLLPGLMPFLSVWGKAKKNAKGDWKMRDQDIYAIEQFMPFLGRLRRLAPNESAKQERLITTYASFLFGLGLRTNTPSAKRGQLIKDKIKHSQDMRDAMDILGRNV